MVSPGRIRAWNITLGVISLVLGVILIVNPGIALTAAAIAAGIFFIIRGLGSIALAYRLHRVAHV
jgi:uncharacterized membrane protein HdeD (DUF308 family)